MKLVAYNQNIKSISDKVLRPAGFSVYQPSRPRGRNSLNATSSWGETVAGYNGSFKILAEQNKDKSVKVMIVDYPSYSETGKSDDMPCRVNGQSFLLKPYSTTITESTTFALRYDAEYEDVTFYEYSNYQLNYIPSDTAERSYYLIGSVKVNGADVPFVSQAHLSGQIIFWHGFYKCND